MTDDRIRQVLWRAGYTCSVAADRDGRRQVVARKATPDGSAEIVICDGEVEIRRTVARGRLEHLPILVTRYAP